MRDVSGTQDGIGEPGLGEDQALGRSIEDSLRPRVAALLRAMLVQVKVADGYGREEHRGRSVVEQRRVRFNDSRPGDCAPGREAMRSICMSALSLQHQCACTCAPSSLRGWYGAPTRAAGGILPKEASVMMETAVGKLNYGAKH